MRSAACQTDPTRSDTLRHAVDHQLPRGWEMKADVELAGLPRSKAELFTSSVWEGPAEQTGRAKKALRQRLEELRREGLIKDFTIHQGKAPQKPWEVLAATGHMDKALDLVDADPVAAQDSKNLVAKAKKRQEVIHQHQLEQQHNQSLERHWLPGGATLNDPLRALAPAVAPAAAPAALHAHASPRKATKAASAKRRSVGGTGDSSALHYSNAAAHLISQPRRRSVGDDASGGRRARGSVLGAGSHSGGGRFRAASVVASGGPASFRHTPPSSSTLLHAVKSSPPPRAKRGGKAAARAKRSSCLATADATSIALAGMRNINVREVRASCASGSERLHSYPPRACTGATPAIPEGDELDDEHERDSYEGDLHRYVAGMHSALDDDDDDDEPEYISTTRGGWGGEQPDEVESLDSRLGAAAAGWTTPAAPWASPQTPPDPQMPPWAHAT